MPTSCSILNVLKYNGLTEIKNTKCKFVLLELFSLLIFNGRFLLLSQLAVCSIILVHKPTPAPMDIIFQEEHSIVVYLYLEKCKAWESFFFLIHFYNINFYLVFF